MQHSLSGVVSLGSGIEILALIDGANLGLQRKAAGVANRDEQCAGGLASHATERQQGEDEGKGPAAHLCHSTQLEIFRSEAQRLKDPHLGEMWGTHAKFGSMKD